MLHSKSKRYNIGIKNGNDFNLFFLKREREREKDRQKEWERGIGKDI